MKKVEKEICPLCQSIKIFGYAHGESREYLHCSNCDLVYVSSLHLISKIDEKAKYDNHQNSPQNLGYRKFLSSLVEPLCEYLIPDAFGLDFGSGPGPTLCVMMQELGYKMDIYDYFYHDDKTVFDNSYDFITTTEVVEHLHNPSIEIDRLWKCLKLGGALGIMTAFRPKQNEFRNWYYKRDMTHVRFFNEKTFQWLASKLDAKLYIPSEGVVILKKKSKDE